MVKMCCQCGKVKRGENWIAAAPPLEDAVSYGYCPACAAEARRRLPHGAGPAANQVKWRFWRLETDRADLQRAAGVLLIYLMGLFQGWFGHYLYTYEPPPRNIPPGGWSAPLKK